MRTQATGVLDMRTVRTPSKLPSSNSSSISQTSLHSLTSPTHALWRSLEWRTRRTILTPLQLYTRIKQHFTSPCTWHMSPTSMELQLRALTSVISSVRNSKTKKMLGMCFTFLETIQLSFLPPPIPALPQLRATCQTLKLARGLIGLHSWTTIRAVIKFNFKLSRVKSKMNCNRRLKQSILLAVQLKTLSPNTRQKLQQLIRRLPKWQLIKH